MMVTGRRELRAKLVAANPSPLLIVLAGCFVGALLVYVLADLWITVIVNLHLLVGAAGYAWRLVRSIHDVTTVKHNSLAARWFATGVAAFLVPSEMLREFFQPAVRSIARQLGITLPSDVLSPAVTTLVVAGITFYAWPVLMTHVAMISGAVVIGALFDLYEPVADRSLLESLSEEPVTAGQTATFKVRLYRGAGTSYPARHSMRRLSIAVQYQGEPIACEQLVGVGNGEDNTNEVVITFVPYKTGAYVVSALFDGSHLRGSAATLVVHSGAADPGQSGFARSSLTHVLRAGDDVRMPMVFIDVYGNQCTLEASTLCLERYYVRLCNEATGVDRSKFVEDPVLVAPSAGRDGCVLLSLRCTLPGLHRLHLVSRSDDAGNAVTVAETLLNDSVRVMVLCKDDWHRVDEITSGPAKSGVYFKASLVRLSGDADPSCEAEPKQSRLDVYCYPSSRQIAIKKYFLNFIPKLMFTFRNNTKLRVTMPNPARAVCIADHSDAVLLELEDASVLAGCIFKWLSNGSGSAHVFEEKRDRLHETLKALHKLSDTPAVVDLSVDRTSLLRSSYSATKALTISRWTDVFQIHFKGEDGIDRGGLRREWMELLLAEVFDPKQSGLFRAVGNGRAIMPDHQSGLALTYYKLAGQIVGKCIADTARGGRYVQPIRLHFARSFLAQILGFHIDHLAFADDDPELFEQKIKYILNCDDIDDLQLTFTDDELDEGGKGGGGRRARTVEIVPKGSSRPVTRANRLSYVDSLARYRFCTRVKERVQAFKDGFHSIVPEDALIAFDESDLALLLTGGVQCYTAADMRPHVTVACHNGAERAALERFWAVASSFTGEQMTRLVQFVTGSSLLPAGGFADLQPKISITFSSDVSQLPMSHTCYNNLCLPAYASVDRMRECLQLAINEGNRGFGLR